MVGLPRMKTPSYYRKNFMVVTPDAEEGKEKPKPVPSPSFCLVASDFVASFNPIAVVTGFAWFSCPSPLIPVPGSCTPWLLWTGNFPRVGTVSVIHVILTFSSGLGTSLVPNEYLMNINEAQITDKTQLLNPYRQDDWLRPVVISLMCRYS